VGQTINEVNHDGDQVKDICIPSSISELFKEEESPLLNMVSRTWLNASFASARVIDTIMDGGWLIQVGRRIRME
jgi:hypothetical protein